MEINVKLKSILWASFLVLCMASVVVLVGMRRSPAKRPLQGFTLYITQTAYPSDRAPFVSATKIRQQKSDGSWKQQTTYSTGRVDIGYGEPGRGVFAVDEKNQKLEYLSGSSPRPLADVDWTIQPGFAGEEIILGYKTYRIHTENNENGDYTDTYICPALQGFPLRMVTGGKRSKTVHEATQVILGEPNFEQAPDLPVSTKRFEEKMKP
jgi:hypothetical protein